MWDLKARRFKELGELGYEIEVGNVRSVGTARWFEYQKNKRELQTPVLSSKAVLLAAI
jgi:hypothetical protein